MLQVVTPPTVQPISLEEAKTHLRVDLNDEDGLILTYIKTATAMVESRTNRALINRRLKYALGGWRWRSMLPLTPVVEIHSVSYWQDGQLLAFPADRYYLDYLSEPGMLGFNDTVVWPAPVTRAPVGEIEFTAGYGVTAEKVPDELLHAVLLLTGHFYQNREALVVGGVQPVELPLGVKALTDPYRIYL